MWELILAAPGQFLAVIAIAVVCVTAAAFRLMRCVEIIARGHPPICACCEAEVDDE